MARQDSSGDRDRVLRKNVLELLRGGHAHVEFDRAVGGLPAKLRGAKPQGQPHTPWRLLEHMRIAQRDILDFSRDGRHVSPDWPQGYWPAGDGPPDEKAWDQSVKAFKADAAAMQELVTNKATDLLAPIPGGQGQTLLREAMLVADHNGYHLGQLIIVRRLLGAWKD